MLKLHPLNPFGWVRDRFDHRDLLFQAPAPVQEPVKFDVSVLSNIPIYNQLHLGSCTANGVGFGIHHAAVISKSKDQFDISRLALYFFEREKEGTVFWDAGAQIRDGIWVAANIGYCPESLWEYSDGPFRFRMSPRLDKKAMDSMKVHHALKYERVSVDESSIKSAMLSTNCPVVIGIEVFPGFRSHEASTTGVIPMPGPTESAIGGHCMAIVGWDNTRRAYKVRNSWSDQWGDHGYAWIPFDYLHNQNWCSDYWLITVVN